MRSLSTTNTLSLLHNWQAACAENATPESKSARKKGKLLLLLEPVCRRHARSVSQSFAPQRRPTKAQWRHRPHLAAPAFLLVTLDIPPVGLLLRAMFNGYFLTLVVAAPIATAVVALDGRFALAVGIGLIATIALASRRWFLQQMDARLRDREAGDADAPRPLRRLDWGGMPGNAAQLAVVIASIPYVAVAPAWPTTTRKIFVERGTCLRAALHAYKKATSLQEGGLPAKKRRPGRPDRRLRTTIICCAGPVVLCPRTERRGVRSESLRRIRRSRLPQTASLATFSGDALTDLLAGLAANCIGSFVKGLTPMRASVAGLFTTDILTKPGMTNSPDSFSSL